MSSEELRQSQERLQHLLSFEGPDDLLVQTTTAFCNERIEASVGKLIKVFGQLPSEKAADIETRLQHAATEYVLPYPQTVRQDESGNIVTLGSGNPVNSLILQTIAHANDRLGIPEYTLLFNLPDRRPGRSITQTTQKSYIHFQNRFRQIAEMAHMQQDDIPTNPLMQLVAVSYVTQIVKDLAVEGANKLARRIRDRQPPTEGSMLDNYVQGIINEITTIRKHAAAIAIGTETLDTLYTQHNISPEHAQILFDIAYATSRGVSSSAEEFRSLIAPVVDAITKHDWKTATELDEFLLHYLGGLFPKWRQREYAKEHQTLPYASIPELIKALGSTLSLDEDDIPDAYISFFDTFIGRKVDAAARTRKLEIITSSTNLSTTILRELFPPIIAQGYRVELRNRRQEFVEKYDTGRQQFIYNNFGVFLENQILTSYDLGPSHISNRQDSIIRNWNNFAAYAYPRPTYTLDDYLRAVLLPRGVRRETDKVLNTFITETVTLHEELTPES